MTTLTHHMLLHWTAVVFYIIATVLLAVSLIFQKERLDRPALLAALLGLIPHTASILIRWQIAGHGPYMARHEVLTSMAWITVALFLIVAWKNQRLRPTGIVVLPLAFLMMAVGAFLNPEIRQLPPSLRSVWLVIHILFNKIAAGSLIIAFATSVLYLLKEKKRAIRITGGLAGLEVLDAYSARFVGFGFVFWSITIGAGAIWANEVWGRYWGWDPIETWSLITWLLFGLYLHLRHFFKWHGAKAAWLMILCFIVSIITLFILPMLTASLHVEYFT